MATPFVHLHVHTQYSLLDGANRIGDLVAQAKTLQQPAIAVTDHGNLFGAIDFYNRATQQGVQPILGMEAYMAPQSRLKKESTGMKEGGYHLLLLAQDRTGYANLLKLASIAYLDGFYYKPRIDREVLEQFATGLICTSACLAGEIPAALMSGDRARARQIAEWYISVFGPDRFFIELQKHIPEQDRVNPDLIDLADQLGIGCLATNDVHFLTEQDHASHDVLCCISTGKLLSDESRMRYSTQLYLKSDEQMRAAMDHPKWAEACDNTYRVARMCDLDLDFSANHAPVVRIDRSSQVRSSQVEDRGIVAHGHESKGDTVAPSGAGRSTGDTSCHVGSSEWYQEYCSQYRLIPFDQTDDTELSAADLKKQCDQALCELVEAGAIWRYGQDGVTGEIRARLDRELQVLAEKNIAAYFLIVWDFVNEARRCGIPANARGSAVGSMVGYCLGLSNACPVKYGLLFERFTDPDRSEYPDIDIDICQDGRQQIIEYVRRKYGHVAQIITFGTLKARAALRDVGRVLNVPLSEVDRVCKLVGDGLGTTIDKALAQEPDLKQLYNDQPTHRQMIDTARRLEGLSRHAGVHAAGVIIATQPLENIIPLYKPSGTEQVVTQWDGPTCDRVGLLKMDFLGLRTLSIIQRCRQLVDATLDKQTQREVVRGRFGAGPCPDAPREFGAHETTTGDDFDPLDVERLTYTDQNVLDLFRRGETAAVFQFESGGFRNLLIGMQPDRIEDLIAANALYRPGPMELIPEYVDRKLGRKPVPALNEIVEKYTGMTYGVLTYQEQVMQLMHELGGVPLRKAYTIIKAISKKKKVVINESRPVFLDGAQRAGMTLREAEDLFERILKFSGYGFNKSHSTGYSILAYQTAYLKTYFPVQYMAAVLTYESVNTDKVVEYMDECKRVLFPDGRRGIEVHPPDINQSEVGFAVVFDDAETRDCNHGRIRFGLNAVKGVGEKAIRAILAQRCSDEGPSPFHSLYDFCDRVPPGVVNRATIEALIKCGAFDSLYGAAKRSSLLAALDSAMAAGNRLQADRDAGQMSFFGSEAAAESATDEHASESALRVPDAEPWSHQEQLRNEKQVLGIYVSSHPLDEHARTLQQFTSATVARVRQLPADAPVVVGGVLSRVKPTLVKQGRSAGHKMAIITLEDTTGPIDGVVFADAYAIASPLLQPDAIVFVVGRIDRRREEPAIVVDRVVPIERAAQELTRAVRIVVGGTGESDGATKRSATADKLRDEGKRAANHDVVSGRLSNLKALLRQSNGDGANAEVLLEVHQEDCVATLRLNDVRVRVDDDLTQRIATVLHQDDCCELIGPARVV